MRMIPLRSSMIASIGFDPSGEILIVQFNGGSFYRYDGVPAETFVSIVTDRESHGHAFNSLVKDRAFSHRQVEPAEVQGL